jgi:hypothetical protein
VSLGAGDGQSLVRPSSLSFGGDGSFYLTELIWSSWRPATASAFGTAHQNDCKPFCAKGHFHRYRVKVLLSRPRTCSNGRVEYTRLSYRFVGRRPTDIPALRRMSAPLGLHPQCP